jgi:hypothetical protein
VRDERGEPIEGASVCWESSRILFEETPEVAPAPALLTDARGEVRLVGVAPTGTVHAWSETHAEATRVVIDGESPVEIVLRPDAGKPREVRVLRAEDGTPLAGARLGVDGRLLATTDERGLARLPAAFARSAVAGAPGRTSVWFEREAAEVRLHRKVAVRCRIVGRSQPTDEWFVGASLSGTSEDAVHPLAPPRRTSSGAEIELELPADLHVALRAGSADGRIARAELDVPPPGTRSSVELVLEGSATLELAVVDESGAPLECMLRVDEGRHGGRILGPRTAFTLGGVDTLHSLRVDAPGYASRQLQASKEAVRQGRFVLELERGNELVIEAMAPTGAPVAGSSVWVSPPPPRARPGIPGWTERTMLGVGGTTDADGRLELAGLVAGAQEVSYQLAGELCPEGSTLYGGPRGTTVVVPRDEPLRLEIPRPRLLEVRATDSISGAPLEQVLVEDTSWMTHERTQNGSVWVGWIPESWTEVRVGAPGYRRERVSLEPGVERLELEVALQPEEAMTLEVEGDLGVALGEELWMQMLYPSPDGTLYGGPGWRVRVEDPVRLEVHAPSKPGAHVMIQTLSSDSGTLRFAPEHFPYEPGTTKRVRATFIKNDR